MSDDMAERFNALGLGGYDWPQVFKYASGSERYSDSSDPGDVPVAVPEGSSVSAAPFLITDVKRIAGKSEGEADERSWVAFGVLNDGRWFCVEASCDYTGWG